MDRRPLALSPEAAAASDVADQLLEAYLDPSAREMQHIGSYELPSDAQVENVIDMCRALLFPGYAGPDVARLARPQLLDLVRLRIDELRIALHRQVYRASHHRKQQLLGRNELECAECTHAAQEITARFVAHLPELRALIRLDLRAAYESDPNGVITAGMMPRSSFTIIMTPLGGVLWPGCPPRS